MQTPIKALGSPSAAAARSAARSPAALAPRETTYQFGVRPLGSEGSGGDGSSLLVTRGHIDIEVFTEKRGGTGMQGGIGPIGVYTEPPHTRPSRGAAAGGSALSP
jgi:hypothetical protein